MEILINSLGLGICVWGVYIALMMIAYIIKFRCKHKWETIEAINYNVEHEFGRKCHKKYTLRCKHCGLITSEKVKFN